MSNSVRLHRWQPTRLLHPWDSPGKNTGMGCHFLLQGMKMKSESEVAQSCLTFRYPVDCVAYQAPPSMGFSRQEYWSGLPFPSPGPCRYFWPNYYQHIFAFSTAFSLSLFLAVPWGLHNLSSPGLQQWKSPVLTTELPGNSLFQSNLCSMNLFFLTITFCYRFKISFSFPICLVYSISFQNFLLKKSFSSSSLSSMFSFSTIPITISFFPPVLSKRYGIFSL